MIVTVFAPIRLPAQSGDLDQSRDLELMQAYQNTMRRISRETLPVVVELEVVERVTRVERGVPSPLDFFFGRPESDDSDRSRREREFEQRGIGSGVIVRRTGDQVYILTNSHVAGNADEIDIRLYDGREFSGELVGTDDNKDLALISFETDEDIPVARLGDSNEVQVGDFVLAVGNPLGFESTVTSGIVSAVERRGPRRNGDPLLTDYIQTDAAINRGNSGGALVNLEGEVIGMNTWIASQTGGSIGLGFAIPINNAARAIDQFIESGSVEYGWLGVNMADPPSSPSDSLKESTGGAFVYSVYDGSPAEEAGLEPGDIIVAVGTDEVSDSDDLLRAVTSLAPGDRTRFRYRRNGEVRTTWVRTGVRPGDGDEISPDDLWPGMSVVEITDQIRNTLELTGRGGDLIIGQVAAGSPAAIAGLRSGDIIVRVNDRDVTTLREFYMALNGADGDEVTFRIRRNDTNLIIGLVK
ncbi:MAG: Do family serine endopeptidase [Alkalispirochaeta sp.]